MLEGIRTHRREGDSLLVLVAQGLLILGVTFVLTGFLALIGTFFWTEALALLGPDR